MTDNKSQYLDRIVSNIIALLPRGVRYPEKIKIRIRILEHEWTNAEFHEGVQKHIIPVQKEDVKVGSIEAYYPDLTPDQFSRNEINLLKVVANLIAESYSSQQIRSQWDLMEEVFHQLAEYIHEVFYVVSVDWKEILYVSPAYEKVWGRSVESLYEDPFSYLETVHPHDRDWVKEKLSVVPKDQFNLEFRITRPDGSIRWIEAGNYPIWDENGQVYRIAGSAEDITQRKFAEKKMKESERKYRNLFENMQDLYYRADLQGRLLMASPALEKITGYRPDEVMGKDIATVFYDEPEIREEMQHLILQNGEVKGYEVPLKHKLGTIIWVSINSHTFKDESGEVRGIEGGGT